MSILGSIISAVESMFGIGFTPEQKTAALDKKAAASKEHLDWRNSIVDLMKLTGMDSSLSARATLAKELGYPGSFTGTAEQNIWLHQKVMDNLKPRW